MRISVLLPVYNPGAPLRQAIVSILRQDFDEFEFLIIDDASTDGSPGIIRDFARRDPRVRAVFHKSNQGLAKTLNEGLETAGGELVARMDADDEALPHRLRFQHLFMEAHPEVAVAGGYVFHMGVTRERDRLVELPVSHSEIVEILKTQNCLYHSSVVLRRREILNLGGYRAEFTNAEDYDLWLRVSRAYQLANLPIPLIRYRFSVSGMSLGRKWEQLYYVFLAQAAREDSGGNFSAWEKEARERLARVDRPTFMIRVAKGTAEKLIRLGYVTESLDFLRFFYREIGGMRTMIVALMPLLKGRKPDGGAMPAGWRERWKAV